MTSIASGLPVPLVQFVHTSQIKWVDPWISLQARVWVTLAYGSRVHERFSHIVTWHVANMALMYTGLYYHLKCVPVRQVLNIYKLTSEYENHEGLEVNCQELYDAYVHHTQGVMYRP